MAISQDIPQPSTTELSLKITYVNLHSNFPGVNELTSFVVVILGKLYCFTSPFRSRPPCEPPELGWTPLSFGMVGCWQINSILANIGRKNSIGILNQSPCLQNSMMCFGRKYPTQNHNSNPIYVCHTLYLIKYQHGFVSNEVTAVLH